MHFQFVYFPHSIDFAHTIIVFLRHGHGSQEVRRSSDGLALVLDEHLMHAHLLSPERSMTSVGLQVEVHLDWAGWTDDLGRDGVHVHLLVEDVDLELALEEKGTF